MDDYRVSPQQFGSVERLHDIVNAFESLFWIDTRKRDIIRRVQRHENARAPRLIAYFGKRRVSPAYAVAALKFICIKPARTDPCGRLDR